LVDHEAKACADALEVEGLAENIEDGGVRGHGNKVVWVIDISWLDWRKVE
jgi:hypothetical protein